MIVTIHQPEHMPWTGYFHKMSLADKYVVLDVVQFKTNNWQNRNRVVDLSGNALWITVPVLTKGHTSSTISDIRINEGIPWRKKYWGRIHGAYCKHPFFPLYADALKMIVDQRCDSLLQLNMMLIHFFKMMLGLETPIVMASDLPVQGKSTALLVDICRTLGADAYLSGPDGREYLDIRQFHVAGIEVLFHSFIPPVYETLHYVPGLSTLDLLMNYGPRAASIIPLQRAHGRYA